MQPPRGRCTGKLRRQGSAAAITFSAFSTLPAWNRHLQQLMIMGRCSQGPNGWDSSLSSAGKHSEGCTA